MMIENSRQIRAKIVAALNAGDFDTPNNGYDLDDEICVEDNDFEFRILIREL